MKKAFLFMTCSLLLVGCGYRAPLHKSYIPVVTDTSRYAGIRPEYQELAALMEKDTELGLTRGNTVTLIADGQENLDMLVKEFREARTSIYVEPYRFKLDTTGAMLADILREKTLEGVDVRIILDKSANTREDRHELRKMEDVGAQVDYFHRPSFWLDRHFPSLATHRDHRKLTLLDGRIAYVGSRNIQDKYFFDWHDVDVRMTGPVVADLTEAFRRTQSLVAPRAPEPYLAPDPEGSAHADTLAGKTQFYDETVKVKHEVETASLPYDEAKWLNQMLTSKLVKRRIEDGSYEKVLISDITSEVTDSDKELIRLKFSWKYADGNEWL